MRWELLSLLTDLQNNDTEISHFEEFGSVSSNNSLICHLA